MAAQNVFIKKIFVLMKFGILLLLVIGIPLYLYFFQREFLSEFKSIEDIRIFLEQYEVASAFIYFACQIVQVIICIIPGQALQLASGYIYGFWLGYLLSIAGIAAGTGSTFFLARALGKDAVYLIFGEKRVMQFVNRLNSKRAMIIILLLYLIPGLPKDLIGYAAGISKMRFLPFLALSLAARTPALMGSIMIGSMLDKGSYIGVIILSVIAGILCILGLVYRKRITAWIDKEYEKFSQQINKA